MDFYGGIMQSSTRKSAFNTLQTLVAVPMHSYMDGMSVIGHHKMVVPSLLFILHVAPEMLLYHVSLFLVE